MSLNVETNQNATIPSAATNNQSIPENLGSTQETVDQINWKKFREERKREREAKENSDRELAKKSEEVNALKAVVEALASKPSVSNDYQEDISEEQKIKDLVAKEMANRDKALEAQRNAKEQEELPYKLAKTFEGFNEVCSAENLDYLEYHYPEVASAYASLPNNFDKWGNIYKAIKKFVPNPDSGPDKRKAENNSLKPQSMSATGATATGDHAPKVLTDKIRADNWARMQKTMRRGL